MPSQYNDGNIPFGSQVVTLSSVSYVAEEIDFTEGVQSIIRRDEVNVPNGAVHTADLIKGTMTLQLATDTTAIPNRFDVVTMTFRGNPKDFIITEVSQPQKYDEIHKIKVGITEKLN